MQEVVRSYSQCSVSKSVTFAYDLCAEPNKIIVAGFDASMHLVVRVTPSTCLRILPR